MLGHTFFKNGQEPRPSPVLKGEIPGFMPSQKSHKPGGGAMISQLSKETPSMSENKSITETHWVLWLLACLCAMQGNLRNNKTKNTKHLLDQYLERKNHF